MSLSVCMIVKNEEEVLGRILSCAKKFADEIIIVDTGSSDKTKCIAKKFTDKIFDFVWEDDFSKARNYSINLSSKEYVMWLDADDYISNENIQKILELKKKLTADFYFFKYATSFDDNNNPIFIFERERIFKRQYQFEGFIHEAVSPKGIIKHENIIIEHRKISNGNPKRNLNIYKKSLKKGVKFSARDQYYYAKEHFYNEQYYSSEINIKKYLKMHNKFIPNEIDAYLTLSRINKFKGYYNKALQILINAMNLGYVNAEILCEIGENHIKKLNYYVAIIYFESAISLPKQSIFGEFVDNRYESLIPLLWLTHTYFKVGDTIKAKFCHNKLKSLYPNNDIVINNDKFFI